MVFNDAKIIALNIWEAMRPYCDIVKIAGSIRREKPEVKDIEVVCLPKMVMQKDLFGHDTFKVRSQDFKNYVTGLGEVIKGKTEGKYMQIHMADPGIMVDLFMPDVADFYRQFAIRTGSADWTARYIAGGWKNLGWCGSDAGLRLQKECVSKTSETDGKKSWICIPPKSHQTLPPHWKSEKEFFDWLKIKWVEPKYRNV